MPFVRRAPLLRVAAVGGAAYMGTKAANNRAQQQQAQQAQQAQQPAQQPEPQPSPAGPSGAPDRIAQLKELGELKSSGVLTDEEFEREKAKILG